VKKYFNKCIRLYVLIVEEIEEMIYKSGRVHVIKVEQLSNLISKDTKINAILMENSNLKTAINILKKKK